MTAGRKKAITLAVAFWISPFWPQSAPAAQDPAREEVARRLAQICGYLERGTTNQRAASLRQLQETITSSELTEFRSYLLRPLPPPILGPLSSHYESLIAAQMEDAEGWVIKFDAARRGVRDRTAKIADSATEDAAAELATLRATREDARKESHDAFRALLAQGAPIAPVLWSRVNQQKPPPYHIARMRARLSEDLLVEVRRQYPSAPRSNSLPPFLRRALVPLIPALLADDPQGWDAFREEIASEALALASELHPERRREARAIFLALGAWGERRLAAWVSDASQDALLSASLRRAFAERNLLAVPAALDETIALDFASYRSQDVTRKLDLVHRLERTAGERGVPVLARLLEIEPERPVQVQAAIALARLGDRRGGDFLERLSFAESAEIATLSRSVLILDARQRRERGDAEEALARLLELLRRFPGDFELHYEIGFTALGLRDFALSIRHFQRALAYQPDSSMAHYNLACAYALHGRAGEAMSELSLAVDAGFDDVQHIEQDPDLASLRELPAYQQLLSRLRGSGARGR